MNEYLFQKPRNKKEYRHLMLTLLSMLELSSEKLGCELICILGDTLNVDREKARVLLSYYYNRRYYTNVYNAIYRYWLWESKNLRYGVRYKLIATHVNPFNY